MNRLFCRSRRATFPPLSAVSMPAAIVAVTICLIPITSRAGQVNSKMPPKPKISSKQAESAALKKIVGRLIASRYEFEDGRWQYAVLVSDKKGQMYEVEVNATTGKVMDTEKTSTDAEAKEEAADKKAPVKVAPKSSKDEKKS